MSKTTSSELGSSSGVGGSTLAIKSSVLPGSALCSHRAREIHLRHQLVIVPKHAEMNMRRPHHAGREGSDGIGARLHRLEAVTPGGVRLENGEALEIGIERCGVTVGGM